jgi:hypothetical protein
MLLLGTAAACMSGTMANRLLVLLMLKVRQPTYQLLWKAVDQ